MNKNLRHLAYILLMLLSGNSLIFAEAGGQAKSSELAASAIQAGKSEPTAGQEGIRRSIRFQKSAEGSTFDCSWSDCRGCSQYRTLCGIEEYVVLENMPGSMMRDSTSDRGHLSHDGTRVNLKALERQGSSLSLEVIGKFVLETQGSVAEVWAHGNFVYLASSNPPSCSPEYTGIWVIDISDPSRPAQAGFIPANQGTRINDIRVEHVETSRFSGDILVSSSEPCNASTEYQTSHLRSSPHSARSSLALWDVSDPISPNPLNQDFTQFTAHSPFIWQKQDRAYIMAVDGDNDQDIHIFDIADPQKPSEISVTGKSDWPGLDSSEIEQPSVFLNDIWVQENDGFVTAYLAYWDAGLVLLDVTNPEIPLFLGDSAYPNPDISGNQPDGDCQIAIPSSNGQVAVSGEFGDSLMRVLDVSDPAKMIQLGHFTPDGSFESGSSAAFQNGSSVFVRDSFAYWSWTREGIRVVDFSTCRSGGGFESCTPTEIAHFSDDQWGTEDPNEDGTSWSIYVHDHPDGGTYIIGSDRSKGLWIFAHP